MKNFIYLFVSILMLASCQQSNTENNQTSHEKDAEGMAKFASDQEFRDKHENPEAIAFDPMGEMVSFPTPDGKDGQAYYVKSEAPTKNYLFVIHEWWGLNDHIKREADRLSKELGNVEVMALDIYDGNVATTREEAQEYMGAVKEERANAIIQGALNRAGADAKIYTIGWCFGGGWSLRASILAGDQGNGCVMYYGMPVTEAKDLAPIKADILCIYADQDKWINEDVMKKFEALAKATGKNLEVKGFKADHAFANPTSPRYNEEAAQQANQLAREFLKGKMD
ncbi:MAG: dienelactone hydrolase family protein [Saprospiraceae bacterium]|nr:dienelactone hydrolase family protein [Saprospiraceae bacterium]